MKSVDYFVDHMKGIEILLFWVVFAAYITHIITCLSDGKWGFLIAGAIAFPIAVVHGVGVWLDFWH